MKTLFICLAFCLPFLALSQQAKDYKTVHETGLKYHFYKDVKGNNAVPENVIKVNFQMYTSTDSLLRDTWKESGAITAYAQKSPYKGSLEEAFLMMSAGDSAAFLISADSMFEKAIRSPMPDFIKKGSFFKFVIKMEGVYTKDEYTEIVKKEEAALIGKEDQTIQDYMTANKLKGVKQPSGLYYVQTQAGKGKKAEAGKTVSVHYTGRLLNGTKFDSSVDRNAPFDFGLGQGQVIKGWDEGIALMSVGEKGILLIPSALGYGTRGAGGSIPPNSVLIFDVELLDVK
ncbi:MAG TPA: FKBP-type peptidyl-prolyl cis-trans isomerase [Cytophagaceae bacterium]|jgi:FKBP-type peptidyl-prolyl cis-trans isomerase FkpA|nr:FKBP-type peptidyl-prolyl cis-trans isomerase [Cytophagaceae bacterium]